MMWQPAEDLKIQVWVSTRTLKNPAVGHVLEHYSGDHILYVCECFVYHIYKTAGNELRNLFERDLGWLKNIIIII